MGVEFITQNREVPSEAAKSMNGRECRIAREALAVGVRQLAALAKVAPATIVRFEASGSLRPRTLAKIRAALEIAGAEFIPENGGGPGVGLKKDAEP